GSGWRGPLAWRRHSPDRSCSRRRTTKRACGDRRPRALLRQVEERHAGLVVDARVARDPHEGLGARRVAGPLTGQIISVSSDRPGGGVAHGRVVRTLIGHRDAVAAWALCANGEWLASVSRDGMLRVWNLADGETLAALFVDGPLLDCAWVGVEKLVAVGAAAFSGSRSSHPAWRPCLHRPAADGKR